MDYNSSAQCEHKFHHKLELRKWLVYRYWTNLLKCMNRVCSRLNWQSLSIAHRLTTVMSSSNPSFFSFLLDINLPKVLYDDMNMIDLIYLTLILLVTWSREALALLSSSVTSKPRGTILDMTRITNDNYCHRREHDQVGARLMNELNKTRMNRRLFIAGITSSSIGAMSCPAKAKESLAVTNGKVAPKSSSHPKEGGKTAMEESISGFVAGASLTVTKTLVKYPLDTATVRLQMKNSDYSINDMKRLLNGSYTGILTPLLANIPAGAIFFAVKDASKQALKEFPITDNNRWIRTLLSVAIAQIPYWLVRNPSEVVKTRQQAGIDGYSDGVSSWDAYKRVIEDAEKSGAGASKISPYYAGYWENILYAFPADAVKFICYDVLSGGKKDISPLDGAVAGALSTAIAQYVTTPLDVIRNRIMASSDNSDSKESYWQIAKKLAQEEGYQGLFAGSLPRVGKALISGAIQFATYEETKQKVANLFR